MENQKPFSAATIIMVIVVILLVVGIVSYFLIANTRQETTSSPKASGASEASSETLGGSLYEQASNPVEGKIPTVNPAANANPIEDIYQNPFE